MLFCHEKVPPLYFAAFLFPKNGTPHLVARVRFRTDKDAKQGTRSEYAVRASLRDAPSVLFSSILLQACENDRVLS
jgi:hypothetical protein